MPEADAPRAQKRESGYGYEFSGDAAQASPDEVEIQAPSPASVQQQKKVHQYAVDALH